MGGGLQIELAGERNILPEQRWLNQLIAHGISLGGARPTANVVDTNGNLMGKLLVFFRSSFAHNKRASLNTFHHKRNVGHTESFIGKTRGVTLHRAIPLT